MKLLDNRSRYAKGLLTRLKNTKSQIEGAKQAGRIEVEKRDMPHSDWGKYILGIIKVIEKQFNKK